MLVPMVGPTTALNWLTVSHRPRAQSHWPTVAERLVGSAFWLHMGSRHSHMLSRIVVDADIAVELEP